MPQDVYTVIALACRYWFAFLGVLIVWRSFSWLRKDRRLTHKRLKTLPDAGMIGELVVLQGSDDLPEESFLPVPREGVMGFLRTCDVAVPVSGVGRQHLDFVFAEGQGLVVTPRHGHVCMVDGEMIASRRDARAFPMRHGSLLSVGDAILKLRLFAGLDAPYAAEFYPDDDPEMADTGEAMPPYGAPAYPPCPPDPRMNPAGYNPGEAMPPYGAPAYPPYPPDPRVNPEGYNPGDAAPPYGVPAYPPYPPDPRTNRGYDHEA